MLKTIFAAKQSGDCSHKLKNQVVVAHEIICCRCGTVVGIDNSQEVSSESIVNLFQEIQPGCKPVKLESCLRIHESKFASSAFSNACDKLYLPRHVSLTAWNIFVKLIKSRQTQKQAIKQDKTQNKITNSNLIKLSNGAIAMFSLFISCRKFGISKSDSQIRKVVELSFSVKHLPSMLKVFSLLKPHAIILGIKTDEDHLDYYLNLYLKRHIKKDMIIPNKIKQHLRNIARVLPGTDEAKARNAIKIVFAGICNKNV